MSRGVAAADNGHLLSFAQLRFHKGRAVINSLTFEFIEVAKRRLVVLCAGGYDDGPCRETVPVVQDQLERPPCAFQAHNAVRDHHSCSEFFGLYNRSCRQLLAGDSGWESQIIFNFGAGSRLSSRCCGSGHKRTQAVARQFQEFAGFRYAAAHQAAASGNHGHFAGELTRPVRCNQFFACEIRLRDLHSSGKEHVERNVLIARFKE